MTNLPVVNYWIDGGTKPYPIIAVFPENAEHHVYRGNLGDTNNMLEYKALIEAVRHAVNSLLTPHFVQINSDSQLLVRQWNGEYKVKKAHLRWLKSKAQIAVRKSHHEFRVMWIPREINKAGVFLDSLK